MAESRVGRLVSELVAAVSNCSLYDKGHPAVREHSEKALKSMKSLFGQEDAFALTMLNDGMLLNDERVTDRGLHIFSFIRRMRRKGLEKVVFKNNMTVEELMELVAFLSAPEQRAGAAEGGEPPDLPNVSLGSIAVGLQDEEGMSAEELHRLMGQNVSRIQEIHEGVSRFKTLDIIGLEEVVASFLSTLKREANILHALNPVKAHSEYTYTHISNVAILSMYQAETLGIGGELLRDIGVGGLLHDIGKMFIPLEVLDKNGKLDDEEWAIMKRHPELGARYLAYLDDVPPVAVIAAYEHHLKFNGTGYPDTVRRDKKQHLIGQILAISDVFDALRTERSYRKALEMPKCIGILKDMASQNELNPLLVDNFLTSIAELPEVHGQLAGETKQEGGGQ